MSSDHKVSDAPPVFEERSSNKTMRKIKENPMVPIGMAGFFAAAVYGFRNYKNRPKNMTISMYWMRFRVFAQSIAVGCMGLGIGYTILRTQYNDHFRKPETDKTKDGEK